MADGQIVFEISADSKKATAAIDDVLQAFKSAGVKLEDAANETGGNMQSAFTKALDINRIKDWAIKGAKILADFGKDAVRVASDLEEVQNVVDVTFGDAGARKIETWAKAAGSQFGITELQAKQYTSTLGAMMKSSGIVGDEIVDISTDLAGLAADMASFYNMDFDTAFDKIRSGLGGISLPLKQLGIDMSVTTLEAYALTQGITKSFNEMSQSEQFMLRYQYLMQATADAQGDFSRTSDSFANSVKRTQMAWEEIKGTMGSLLLEVVEPLTAGLADFLGRLTTPTSERTIFDDINDIKLDADTKISQIQSVANKAQSLLESLEEINGHAVFGEDSSVSGFIEGFTGKLTELDAALGGAGDMGGEIGKIAEGANALNAGSNAVWAALLETLKQADGLSNVFTPGAAGNVTDLAAALSGSAPDVSKADAWRTFLDALGANAGALSALTGESAEETAAWLETVKGAVEGIDENDAQSWNSLLQNFVSGLPGLNDTQYGEAFFNALAQNFLALGTDSEIARAGLTALGLETDDISEAQKGWLGICNELVKAIPGLSSIINTQTGEIEGGAQAVKDYIEAWQADKIYQTQLDALKKQRDLIEQELNVDYLTARANAKSDAYTALRNAGVGDAEAKKLIANNDVDIRRMDFSKAGNYLKDYGVGTNMAYVAKALNEYLDAMDDIEQRQQNARYALEAYDAEVEEFNALHDGARAEIEAYAAALEDAAGSTDLLTRAAGGSGDALTQVESAVKGAEDALKALADYQEKMRQETLNSVKSTISGFNEIETPAQKARSEMQSLEAQIKKLNEEGKNADGLLTQKKALESNMPSFQSMQAALDSQLEFMRDYQKELNAARANGISDAILASLSDGTQESFDYLYALNHTLDENALGEDEYAKRIEKLNQTYREVQDTANSFTNTLTDQKLTADEEFNSLVESVQQAVGGLDMGETAYSYMSGTLDGIVSAIGDKSESVKSAVDGIIAEIDRLKSAGAGGFSGMGYGAWLNPAGTVIFRNSAYSKDGSYASGLDYVPYDGYLAMLHQGERIQTAAEADLARRYSYSQPAFDYQAMGGAIGAAMPEGGNVYLDGETVGRIVSARQANSFRSLERSGWRG